MLEYKLALTLLLVNFLGFGQNLTVEELTINENGMVSFLCDIKPHHSIREQYEVQVYSSKDFFKEPLQVNLPVVRAGEKVLLNFDGNEVVGDYDGFITFKFGVKATLFPIELTQLKGKYKRGKPITLSWEDLESNGSYDVLIYKDDSLYQTLASNLGEKNLTTTLSKSIPKGNYQIKVLPKSDKQLISDDYEIEVKSSNGLILVGGGGILAGGIIYLMSSSSDNPSDLPTPPGLPN
ncbi:MAG: hypothetical protein ACJA2S_004543 [Cyclobacteriaceae bacterium]|jgi:hypothetical protein